MDMNKKQNLTGYTTAMIAVLLSIFMEPALAHHLMGGKLPTGNLEGLISGLAHPIIGLDHLAFIVAVGLLAALIPNRGYLVPVAFVLATIAGTGLHLATVTVVYNEAAIAFSVIAAGLLLFFRVNKSALALLLFSTLAGIAHGYAYGESIVGAETSPLVAYLTGFCLIQLSIAIGLYLVFSSLYEKKQQYSRKILQFSGITISLIGAAFLAVST
jgi:urease accessory protein